VAAGWGRLDAALDAPRRGPVEAALVRLGVADHTARLLAATPALRASWLTAIGVTLALGVLAARLGSGPRVPTAFLALGPLLPLAGIAASYGPGVDPTHELSVVSPTSSLRLLLLRCAAVLTVTSALGAAASLALPAYGLASLAWFLPALAVTLVSLALVPRLGPRAAVAGVAGGWAAVVALVVRADAALLAGAGVQAGAAVAAAAAAAAILLLRADFDTVRPRRRP
jgi:hypothetical protein